MKQKWTCIAVALLSLTALTACKEPPAGGNPGDTYEDYTSTKQPGNDSFDYPGNYAAPELNMDGKGEDAEWLAITEPLATFGHGDAATVKAYRGEDALFFLFEVRDTILLTEGMANDDTVTRSDSIEFYLDTLADGGSKPQNDDYQINLGIHGKTRIMQGSGSGWGNWNGLIDYEVFLDGTLNDGTEANDTGYSVEVMIPYAQINIEKDDTIAISFGHVDKVGPGSAAGSDWDWYPWLYKGAPTEPQTPDNYVLLDKDNALMSRDEEVRPNAEMAGYVTDGQTQQPIVGATVSVLIGGSEQTTTTDEAGFFSFADVDPEGTYTVVIEKDGYISNSVTYTRAELRAANGGRVQKDISVLNESTVARTELVGTVKNVVDGAIGGATVRIEGTTMQTTASADGTFSIADVPVVAGEDVTLTVSKAGYGTSKTVVKSDSLVSNGETEVGDVNINLPYAQTGAFGLKNANFADSSMEISRTLTGVEFLLTGTRQLSGHIEIYVDTKDCAAHRDNDTSFWCFNLEDTGRISGNHYAGGVFKLEGLEYTLEKNDSTGYSARFFVPYTYLGITPFEVFGISLGQWSTTANDWDGWGFAGQFVAPETPATLIRLSATNELYRADSNASMVTLSGNVGMQGVRVSVEGTDYAVTTGANGAWNMRIPATANAINLVYSIQGYQTQTTQIAAGYFDTHYAFSENVTMQEQSASVSGTVTDSVTGDPVEGVTVTVVGTQITATTNASGEYTLSGISTFSDVSITFVKEGYATQQKDISAADLSQSATHDLDVSFVSNAQVAEITLSGTVTNVNGAVAGATVTVEGTEYTATTNASGEWTIENFKSVDSKIVITKDGYIQKTLSYKAENLTQGADSYSMGEVDFVLDYVVFGELEEKIADAVRNAFPGFTFYVTRTETAFEFKMIGKRAFAGANLEFYLDIGANNARDYQLIFQPDGSLTVNHYTGSNTSTSALTWEVKNVETAAEIYLTLPYTFLGVQPTDIIGVTAGSFSTAVGDWDPMMYELVVVAPENGANYVRLDSNNTVFRHTQNEQKVTLSGNVSMSGVTVSFNGFTATSGNGGAWSMVCSMPTSDLQITYSKLGYETQTQTVALADLAGGTYTAESVTLVEKTVTVSGTVTESGTGEGLEGVVVSVVGTDVSATTNANGEYTISVGAASDITLRFTLDGYTAPDASKTATELNGSETHVVDAQMVSTNQVTYITLKGTVSNLNGNLEEVTVVVEGTPDLTATTNANGEFTIENFPVLDANLILTKAGYLTTKVAFVAENVGDGAAEYTLATADMPLEYAALNGIIADKNDDFAAWKGYVTRSNVGFEFKFIGSRAFNGRIELFVDTGASSADNARDASDYLFNLNSNGTITIVNWAGGGNETPHAQMQFTVLNAASAPEAYFTLPYAFLGIESTDIIGISVGQWSTTANGGGGDWDGWDDFAHAGISGNSFVKPEWTQDYIRIGLHNELYALASNVAVDFTSYDIHFATGENNDVATGAYSNAGSNPDNFYAKVTERNETGVTFSFITTGAFGTNGAAKEFVVIYFDTGATVNGWDGIDYTIRIYSDGTVVGKAGGPWWKVGGNETQLGTVVINNNSGVITFEYTVTYETLGITQNDVFGVAMREACDNDADMMIYEPWWDCYYQGTRIDAANSSQYVRVSADGTLYQDNDNVAGN